MNPNAIDADTHTIKYELVPLSQSGSAAVP